MTHPHCDPGGSIRALLRSRQLRLGGCDGICGGVQKRGLQVRWTHRWEWVSSARAWNQRNEKSELVQDGADAAARAPLSMSSRLICTRTPAPMLRMVASVRSISPTSNGAPNLVMRSTSSCWCLRGPERKWHAHPNPCQHPHCNGPEQSRLRTLQFLPLRQFLHQRQLSGRVEPRNVLQHPQAQQDWRLKRVNAPRVQPQRCLLDRSRRPIHIHHVRGSSGRQSCARCAAARGGASVRRGATDRSRSGPTSRAAAHAVACRSERDPGLRDALPERCGPMAVGVPRLRPGIEKEAGNVQVAVGRGHA